MWVKGGWHQSTLFSITFMASHMNVIDPCCQEYRWSSGIRGGGVG
jgi:hypothetical protein